MSSVCVDSLTKLRREAFKCKIVTEAGKFKFVKISHFTNRSTLQKVDVRAVAQKNVRAKFQFELRKNSYNQFNSRLNKTFNT